ncbi:MAG: penicillin-binding protein 2 [Gammaproteobacteria bacterium]
MSPPFARPWWCRPGASIRASFNGSSSIDDAAWQAALFRRRVAWSVALVIAMCVALVARMALLQVVDHRHFQTLSEDNRVNVQPIAPMRGFIYDRNGLVLAENLPSYSLEVTPESAGELDKLLRNLRDYVEITEAEEQRFRAQVKRKPKFEAIPLKLGLDSLEVARLSVNRYLFAGVEVMARPTRHYPLGESGSHLIGYVGRISEAELKRIDPADYRASTHIGKTGVELYYEQALHGTVGYQHVETNAQGRVLRVLDRRDPIPGQDIYLTLDASLQAVAERALGSRKGAVVAIEPSTGAVLAFASTPNFDPNVFVHGISTKAYQALISSPDRPLFNRALRGQYPPGSTIKPLYALAGLELSADTARHGTTCGGYYQLPGHDHRYRDWRRGGHGRMDTKSAIAQSCDVYFYRLAMDLGIESMHDFATLLGLGRPTGIDLSGEASGVMPSSAWKRAALGQPWYPGETVIAGIGQGFTLSTPLQLASFSATLAMRGLQYKPRVVLRVVGPDGREVSSLEPTSALPENREEVKQLALFARPNGVKRSALYEQSDGVRRIGHPSHWRHVVDAMVEVVHGKRGTARRVGATAIYRMAGKTGTAQVFNIGQDEEYDEDDVAEKLRDHGLFIAFAPADKPKIAVSVIVENGGGGSTSAAPVAREVMDHYLVGELGPPRPPEDVLRTASKIRRAVPSSESSSPSTAVTSASTLLTAYPVGR